MVGQPWTILGCLFLHPGSTQTSSFFALLLQSSKNGFKWSSHWILTEYNIRTLLGILEVPPKLLSLIISILRSLFYPLFLPSLQFSSSFWLLLYCLYVWCSSPLYSEKWTLIKELLSSSGEIEELKIDCSAPSLFYLFCFSFPQLAFILIPFLLLFSSSSHPLSYYLFSVFVTDFWQ